MRLLESRMMGNYHVRFGEGRLEKGSEDHLASRLLYEFNLRDSEIKNLNAMFERVMRFELLHTLLSRSATEVAHYWKDETTGLKCKAKFDLVVSDQNLVDFKTTSATNIEEFETQLQQHDYDRQTAFYLDGFKGTTFMVIGVQKFPPFNIYQKVFHIESDFVKKGRKKYQFLMQKLAEQNRSTTTLAKAS